MQQRVLTIDGGGSKTDATLRTIDGTTLATARAGPANLATDPHATQAVIDHLWRTCAATAALDPAASAQTTTLSAALAGISSAPGRHLIQTASPFGRTLLCADAYAAVIGAFAGAPGALLIVGTGTIACRLDAAQTFTRIGGWGFPASDQGSGAWLGLSLIQSYLNRLDLNDPAPTDALLTARLGTTRDAITAWLHAAGPADYASLAPLALPALLDEATRHLAALIRAIGPAPRLAIAGGLASTVAPRLEAIFGPIERPLTPALDGAFLIATGKAAPEFPQCPESSQ